jgi:hypothetical protein
MRHRFGTKVPFFYAFCIPPAEAGGYIGSGLKSRFFMHSAYHLMKQVVTLVRDQSPVFLCMLHTTAEAGGYIGSGLKSRFFMHAAYHLMKQVVTYKFVHHYQ